MRLQHLVVIIPGIGGSVLAEPGVAPGGFAGNSDRAAGVRFSTSPATIASALLSPDSLDLKCDPGLVPVGLVTGFSALAPLVTLPGYRQLVKHLKDTFDRAVIDTYRPPAPVRGGVDVLLFPYDFRRPVVEAAARLDEAVNEALQCRGAGAERAVIVVAHSMGGLVARYWAGVLGGWARCRALIMLGTPHRGAPKALDWLVNGVGVGPIRLPAATRVVRDWPSVYELLPQYEAVLDTPGDGVPGTPIELTALSASLLTTRPVLAGYAEQFAQMALAGRRTHERIAAAWVELDPAVPPEIVSYMGRGHATPNLAVLNRGRLTVSKADPPWRGNVGWRGDGTVPMISAIPREQNEQPGLWRVLPDRHGPLGSAPEPVDLIGLYQGEQLPARGGELPDRPWLGLDADDYTLAGAEYPVEAVLLPASLTGQTAWVTRTPLEGTSGQPYQDRLSRATPAADGAQAWRGTLPGCGPGGYEVAVEVTGVPSVGRITARTIAVVLAEEVGDDAWESG